MSASAKLVKYALLVVDAVIFLSGIIMLIAGSVVQNQINSQNMARSIGGYSTSAGSVVCILFGILLLAFSLFGLMAAVRDSHSLLTVYAAVMALVFLVQIITGITGLSVKNSQRFADYMGDMFEKDFQLNSSAAADRDFYQTHFSCCGWKNLDAYRNASNANELNAPASCCIKADACAQPQTTDQLYGSTCQLKMMDAVRHIIEVTCAILVVFSLCNLLSIVLSFVLARQIKVGYQYS